MAKRTKAIGCTGPANNGNYNVFIKEADVHAPANIWLLDDEQPDSINDAAFAFAMPADTFNTRWIDVPAKYHVNAGGFTFLDGHAVIHKWRNPQSIPTLTYNTPLTTGSQAYCG